MLSYSTAMRSSGMTMSGHTSTMLEERPGHAHRVEAGRELEALGQVLPQLRLDGGCRGRRALAGEGLADGKRRCLRAQRLGSGCGWADAARDAARNRASSAGRMRGGLASTEHSGHHDERRRSRPGRCALLPGGRGEQVPDLALPEQQHLGGRRDLGEGDPRVELGVVLPDQRGVRRPGLAIGPDRERHVGVVRELPSRPPRLDALRHGARIRAASDARPGHLKVTSALRLRG